MLRENFLFALLFKNLITRGGDFSTRYAREKAAMQQYICTGGCRGESSSPGMCQAEDCKKEGDPLMPCDCGDSTHHNIPKEEGEKEVE
jgi:hypothetical protein